MGAGFTPGPWVWVGDDEIEQIEHPFTSVAEVVRLPRNIDPDREQKNANARLIAAAPELYEALAELHRACMGTPVGGGDGGTYLVGTPSPDTLNKANATLRKARGEA